MWLEFINITVKPTCEIRTPLGLAKSVPYSKVSSFQGAICTENSNLGPDEVSLFNMMSSFRRVAIHKFHCVYLLQLWERRGETERRQPPPSPLGTAVANRLSPLRTWR
jgi:hypothetical protein